jgi:REP element-mobilizing transposase RayT
MVAGYHLIWTVYGYWLPNDPRGSTSTEIRVEPLGELGEIHYGRKPVQPTNKTIREFHKDAQQVLKHPVLTFSEEDVELLGHVFGEIIADRQYVCYACAVMPDHVHMLIRRHHDRAEDMIQRFQEISRTALIEARRRVETHPVWTKGPGWKTFVNTQQQFRNEISYIERTPDGIGRPRQMWDFVMAYDGWMPELRTNA